MTIEITNNNSQKGMAAQDVPYWVMFYAEKVGNNDKPGIYIKIPVTPELSRSGFMIHKVDVDDPRFYFPHVLIYGYREIEKIQVTLK